MQLIQDVVDSVLHDGLPGARALAHELRLLPALLLDLLPALLLLLCRSIGALPGSFPVYLQTNAQSRAGWSIDLRIAGQYSAAVRRVHTSDANMHWVIGLSEIFLPSF